MKPPLGRVIIGLLMIAGIFAAYALFMWVFGSWTYDLIYVQHNTMAWALLMVLIIGGGFFYELITTGEIKWSETKRWRPKRPPVELSTGVGKVLELRPDEYQERH